LGRESEYSTDQVAELRDLISVFRDTVNRNRSSRSIEVSFRSKSIESIADHRSVNKSHVNEDQDANIDVVRTEAVLSTSSSVVEAQIGSGRIDNSIPSRPTYVRRAWLSEIPLPIFHDDIFKWLMFRDHFTNQVHRDPNLPDIDKFYCLVGCLRDKALEAIAGIPVCGENYALAWSTLTACFDRPRLVASSLIDILLSAPKSPNETLVE